jgi:serine/threonine-protein kinase
MVTDTPHIEMEYVEGEDLESRMIRKGAMGWQEALPLFTQVADALAYMHERRVCHRDIKPSNLLLQANGQVKLVDFGIALESGANPLTVAGMTFGSLGYVPPEWMDAKLDHVKWDIYSFGVLCWELLTGSQAWPVLSGGQQEMIRILSDKAKRSYLDVGDAFPTRLRALVADMTMADRARRLGSASEVRTRLDAITAPVRPARPAPAGASA